MLLHTKSKLQDRMSVCTIGVKTMYILGSVAEQVGPDTEMLAAQGEKP